MVLARGSGILLVVMVIDTDSLLVSYDHLLLLSLGVSILILGQDELLTTVTPHDLISRVVQT